MPEAVRRRGPWDEATAVRFLAEARIPIGLVIRYQGGRDSDSARWLLERREDELALAVAPDTIPTRDSAGRMGDAPARP